MLSRLPSETEYTCGFVPLNEREAHEKECPHRMYPCRLGCGQWFKNDGAKVGGTVGGWVVGWGG